MGAAQRLRRVRWADGLPLSGDQMMAVRHIHAVLKPWHHATSLLQSDKPQFFAGSAYLPVMYTLKHMMQPTTDLKMRGAGADISIKEDLPASELHPIAARLRAKLLNEIDINWRRVRVSEEQLCFATSVDPRYKLTLWTDHALKKKVRNKTCHDDHSGCFGHVRRKR